MRREFGYFERIVALQIMKKLACSGVLRKKHAKMETLLSGIPSDKIKNAKEAFRDFVKEGFLISHPTAHEMTYGLSKNGEEEFRKYLDEYIKSKEKEFGLKRID